MPRLATPALPLSDLPQRLPRRWWRGAAAACVTVAMLVRPAAGQGVASVRPDDPAYRDIDRLAAAGLIDTIVMGQRPYSWREMRRLVAEAARNAARSGDDPSASDLRATLARLALRFADDAPDRALLGRMDVLLTATSAQPRLVPPDPGIGGIDAVIAPLDVETSGGGRDGARGGVAAVETSHALVLGDHVALDARPWIRGSTVPAFTGERRLGLHAGGVRIRSRNVVVSAGREPLAWGFGRHGTLFLSGDARPLDQVRIGGDAPWVPPGALRVLGPSMLSLFVADLGPRQVYPHTALVGYKWSALPARGLEVGVSVLDFVGGRGAPRASAGRIIENIFLFPVLPTESYAFSNTMAGLEARYRLRRLGGAQAYWEMSLDDFDRRRLVSSLWRDDAAHLAGLALPRLGADGRFAATVEAHHAGTRFGRHFQFRSGPTLDRFLLGDPLGPDADGGYAYLDWRVPAGRPDEGDITVGVELAEEAYRSDEHAVTTTPFTIQRTASRPQERRHRALLTLRRVPAVSGLSLSLGAGVERVARFGFVDGPARTGAVGSLGVGYAFR